MKNIAIFIDDEGRVYTSIRKMGIQVELDDFDDNDEWSSWRKCETAAEARVHNLLVFIEDNVDEQSTNK